MSPAPRPQYVLGFAFSDDHSHVVLIEKSRPEWQRGRLNGVGGKIEGNEEPRDAMQREFREETGVDTSNWRQVCVLQGPWGVMYVYTTTALPDIVRTTTDEVVNWYDVRRLPSTCLRNVHWLVPMALSGEEFDIEEVSP